MVAFADSDSPDAAAALHSQTLLHSRRSRVKKFLTHRPF
eukprot:SAG11_NODE_22819_length_399_cov_1.706667_1_plen_38_part_10